MLRIIQFLRIWVCVLHWICMYKYILETCKNYTMYAVSCNCVLQKQIYEECSAYKIWGKVMSLLPSSVK